MMHLAGPYVQARIANFICIWTSTADPKTGEIVGQNIQEQTAQV